MHVRFFAKWHLFPEGLKAVAGSGLLVEGGAGGVVGLVVGPGGEPRGGGRIEERKGRKGRREEGRKRKKRLEKRLEKKKFER